MRKKSLANRCAMAIVAASMAMSPLAVSMATPLVVYAETVQDNPVGGEVDIVPAGDTMEQNEGFVRENNGSIDYNTGQSAVVDENAGYIAEVSYGATVNVNTIDGRIAGLRNGSVVNENDGTIESVADRGDGAGTITLNNGNVDHLYNNGEITNNFGSVGSAGGSIVNQYGGNVNSNYHNTTITNYFDGDLSTSNGGAFTITNNFADVDNNTPDPVKNATNQYRSVSFVGDEYSTTTYGTGITQQVILNPSGDDYTNYYVRLESNAGGSGTITISPNAGYEYTAADVANGQLTDNTFNYNLRKQPNGSYVLEISGVLNSLDLHYEMFGLIAQAIQQSNPDPDLNTVQVSYVTADTSITSNTVASVATAGQSSHKSVIDTKISKAINHAPSDSSIIIALGKDPCMTKDAMEALFSQSDVEKKILFTHEGREYYLTIPAYRVVPIASISCMKALSKEKGGFAGPMRIAKIFETCGFRLEAIKQPTGTSEPLIPEAGGDSSAQIQTHNTLMGSEVGMAALSAGNDQVSTAAEGLVQSGNGGTDGVSSFAQIGGGSLHNETG